MAIAEAVAVCSDCLFACLLCLTNRMKTYGTVPNREIFRPERVVQVVVDRAFAFWQEEFFSGSRTGSSGPTHIRHRIDLDFAFVPLNL